MKRTYATIKMTGCAAALAMAFPTFAQQVASDTAQQGAGNANGTVQEVIVTASKRKESIQSVPMAVDAVTGAAIQKMNIMKFEDVAKLVPGLELNPADGRGQTVELRGITFDPDTGTSPAVQIYWNETPISASDAFRGLFDVGRVEVLRGPQGTLRGVTTPAGAITIGTERPDTSEFGGRVIQTIGARDLRNTQAAINVPLIQDVLAVRVAGLNSYSESGVHNINNGQVNSDRGQGARVSVLYQPTKSLEFLLVHQQLTSNTVSPPIAFGRPFPGQPGPELALSDRTSVVEGPYAFYNKTKLTSLNATWDVAGHRLSYIGGFQQSTETDDRDTDIANVIPGWSNQQTVGFHTQQRTHELRLESTGTRFWNYMVGAYYSYADGPAKFTQPFPYNYPAGQFAPPDQVMLTGSNADGSFGESSALFTDHRFAVTDADQLEFGVRVQKNRSYNQQYIDVFGQRTNALPENLAHMSTKAWTGSASYRHNFSKNLMAYLSAGTGYRPGGASAFVSAPGLAADLINYQPEKSKSFELGFKATLLQRRLVLNADIFQQNINNYIGRANALAFRTEAVPGEPAGSQPGGAYPADLGGTINLNTNGDVISRGIEATAILSILPNWRAQVSGSYVNAHYKNALLYCNDGNNDGIPDADTKNIQPGRQVSVCRSNRPLADPLGTESGRFSMVVQSEYTHDFGPVDGFVRGLVRYTPTRYNVTTDEHLPSFIPLDIFVGVREPGQKWEVSIWAQNVFNRSNTPFMMPSYSPFGDKGGYLASVPPAERRIGATVRYDF